MNIQLVLNVPLQLALADPGGDYNPEREEVSYPTADGRLLVLATRAAERLNALDLRPGESFSLCRRWDGSKGSIPRIDFWLSPTSEKARAAEESANATAHEAQQESAAPPAIPTDHPEPRKRGKRGKVEQMPIQQPPAQPQLWDGRGNGTYGPTPRPAIAAAGRPTRVPYNVAFREIVGFVTAELKASGEQWSDQARQDLVSTVLISASREGLLQIWERP